jgi:hypothetical protein
MPSHKITPRNLALIVFSLLVGAAAWGQQFAIQKADYGHGHLRVDVTQRLRELARSNTTFRMGNSTFGIDPAPGMVKTLRIIATGPRGATRTFEYREGSVVDGSRFTGWGGGNWGNTGQYQILGAWYGTAHRNVDVTQRLRELAKSNTFFRMGNSTFGVDPAHGVVKTLRIWAHGPRGDEKQFDYREGSLVDGALFTGWGGGNWGGGGWNGGWNGTIRPPVMPPARPPARPPVRPPAGGQLNIVKAMFGVPGRNQDVAGRLQSMVRNGRLIMTINKSTLGVDPAPGVAKTLWVTYSTGGGQQRQVTVQENGQLNIP